MQTNTSSAVRHYQFVSANIAFTPKQFLTVSFLTYPHVQTTRNSHISKKSIEKNSTIWITFRVISVCFVDMYIYRSHLTSLRQISKEIGLLNCWVIIVLAVAWPSCRLWVFACGCVCFLLFRWVFTRRGVWCMHTHTHVYTYVCVHMYLYVYI